MLNLSPLALKPYTPPENLELSIDIKNTFSLEKLALEIQLICALTSEEHSLLLEHLLRHVGPGSSFTHKEAILNSLIYIYQALLQKSDISEKLALASSLTTHIELCTNGFHDRVMSIYQTLNSTETLEFWLHEMRQSIVERAARNVSDEVHTHNAYFNEAASNYGVLAISPDDAYVGAIVPQVIQDDLHLSFSNEYQPFAVISFLTSKIQDYILSTGLQALIDSKSYQQDIITAINEKLNELLTEACVSIPALINFDENYTPLSINTQGLKNAIYNGLIAKGFLEIKASANSLFQKLIHEEPMQEYELIALGRMLITSYPPLISDIIHQITYLSAEEKICILEACISKMIMSRDFNPMLHRFSLMLLAKHFNLFENLNAAILKFPSLLGHDSIGFAFSHSEIWGADALYAWHRNDLLFTFCLKMSLHYAYYDVIFMRPEPHVPSLLPLLSYPKSLFSAFETLKTIPYPMRFDLLTSRHEGGFSLIEHALTHPFFSGPAFELLIQLLTPADKSLILHDILTHALPQMPDFISSIESRKFVLFIQLCTELNFIETLNSPLYTSKQTLLHQLVQLNFKEALARLINTPININPRDEDDYTPLHWAILDEHEEMAQCLIKHGAELDCENTFQETPLMLACEHGHLNIVKALVEKGAKINGLASRQTRPLHLACEKGHLAIVQFLIEQNANLNETNINDVPPFFSAILYNQIDIVKYMVSQGVNVAEKKGHDLTALHWAASYGHVEIAAYLLEKGADINARDDNLMTSLHAAALRKKHAMVEFLLKNHARTDLKNLMGLTALDIARQRKNQAVIDTLLLHIAHQRGIGFFEPHMQAQALDASKTKETTTMPPPP